VTRTWIVPGAWLGGYGIAFAMASLGASLPVFDDHPGQLYRMWHAVNHGLAPWRWNDGWWAGYPELQFYPPGFSYAGALLHGVSLGRLSVERAYQALVWLTYLGPGLTTFALLSKVLGNGWLALPGAFVALTLSAGLASGVEGGVHVGMVAARLAWALLPLLALQLRRWIETDTAAPLTVVPVVAALAITHPAHGPAAIILVLVSAVGACGRRLLVAIGMLALAAALTAFWTVPLVARLGETRALAWSGVAPAGIWSRLLLAVLLVLATLEVGLGLFRASRPNGRSVAHWVWSGSRLEWRLALYPWAMGFVVIADLLAERVGFRWLPVNRIIDGYWMAVVIAAGLAMGRIIERASARVRPGPALAALAIGTLVVLSVPGRNLALWPRPSDWPSFPDTARGLRLDDLWSLLRTEPPGRVLFVRSSVPLVYGTEWWRPHTHITALAPLFAGRPIVHGTFTHPSPIAALVYRGTYDRAPITALAETLDGRTLFGRPLGSLDPRTVDRFADRLGITAIVALEEDVPKLRGLESVSGFGLVRASPPFVVYARLSPGGLPAPVGDDRLAFDATGEPGSWVSARLTYYPLWRAADGDTALATRRGPLGDLEVHLSRRHTRVTLTYGPGAPEIVGVTVSAIAALAWAGCAIRVRRVSARATSGIPGPPARTDRAADRTLARSFAGDSCSPRTSGSTRSGAASHRGGSGNPTSEMRADRWAATPLGDAAR
jgi:hypothetical protein